MGLRALLMRDVRLGLSDGAGLGTALGFYLVVIAILPLGLGPDLKLLGRIAPGVLWIGLLLAALLSADRLFYDDARDGSLELLMLGAMPLEFIAIAKMLAHWLTTALPLIVLTPLLALMLNLEPTTLGPLLAAMLAGTPAVSAIAAIGAALTMGIERGGLILSVIVLPFYIPTLIFGVSATSSVAAGATSTSSALLILTAISIAACALAPFAAAAALRAQMR